MSRLRLVLHSRLLRIIFVFLASASLNISLKLTALKYDRFARFLSLLEENIFIFPFPSGDTQFVM